MRNWYLLMHNSSYNKLISVEMRRMGVTSFCPTRTKLRKRADRPSYIKSEIPLFPGYLFLNFDPDEIHTTQISAVSGAHGFVRFGGDVCVVKESVIEAMKNILVIRTTANVESVEYRNIDPEIESALHKIMDLDNSQVRISAFCSLMQEQALSGRIALRGVSRKRLGVSPG